MSQRELDAAGITDPTLRVSYEACRAVNSAHGRTFYLATLLLPAAKRPAIHALYGFARHADDIVDDLDPALSVSERERALAQWGDRFLAGADSDPLLPAVHDTVARFGIGIDLFEDFLASMRMDLTRTEYATWDDLMEYVHGSAAVIGLQVLPVLGAVPGAEQTAQPYARDLGLAFQLTNFIRDVGEDLRRGRIYLPMDELTACGLTREHLIRGGVDDDFRRLLRLQIDRARALYRAAEPGIALLDPASRDCVRTAAALYEAILDRVEAADYRVLDRRVSVGIPRRLAVALPGVARARRARRRVARTG